MQSLELKNNPFYLLPDIPCKRLCLLRSSSVLLLAWGSPSPPPCNGFINSFINYLQGLEVPDLPSSATQGSLLALLWVRVPVVRWDVQGAPCLQRGPGHNLKAKNLQEVMEHSPRRLGVGSSRGAAPAASSGLETLRGAPYTHTTPTPSSWGPGHARPWGLPLCNPQSSLKLAGTYGRARRSSSCHPPKSDELR